MPWFEEQLRTRRAADDAAMTEALDSMEIYEMVGFI